MISAPDNRNSRKALRKNKIQFAKDFRYHLSRIADSRVTVCLDWLSVLFMDGLNKIPEPLEGSESVVINERITLVYTGKGTEHFKTLYNLYYKGEHLASIVCHTRNPKFMKSGVVKIDFKNHLLYSADLWPVYDDIVSSLYLEYKNVSRVDIAMDGMNYLLDFLNQYVKQQSSTKVVELKGRPQFSAKILDRKTMYYQNFLVGALKSKKKITVYNKSLDIVKTGKDYIQRYWQANGMLNELMPLDILLKALKDEPIERTNIPGYENIFRFEIRLRGESIKEIKGFTMDMLRDPNKLVSIMRLQTRNFFDFVWLTDKEVSKCPPAEVIPFDRFTIIPLEKIERQERDDLYKTKLSLKKNIRQLYLGKISPDESAVFEMIHFDIKNYSLNKWFADKLTIEWDKEYEWLNPDYEQVVQVKYLINNMLETVYPGAELPLERRPRRIKIRDKPDPEGELISGMDPEGCDATKLIVAVSR